MRRPTRWTALASRTNESFIADDCGTLPAQINLIPKRFAEDLERWSKHLVRPR
ncbi:hypothetical protein SBV1_700010 [Verrucomicrobia bacterium]|nr:hypothetical protein SBV1_700010 [Verrucomicrobiota bacterium]